MWLLPNAAVEAYRSMLRRARRYQAERRYAGVPRASVFQQIYRRNHWGDAFSSSGSGSNLAATQNLRLELPRVLKGLDTRTMLDAPCGDFKWMRRVDLSRVDYIGADIVADMIEELNAKYGGPRSRFVVLDVCRDTLPAADVILCRDCLVHLSFEDALAALKNFRNCGAKWLLSTTFPTCRRNDDIITGSWRPINLTLPPFSLSAPTLLIDEKCVEGAGQPHRDKALGVWPLQSGLRLRPEPWVE
jgi:hypothetical protein